MKKWLLGLSILATLGIVSVPVQADEDDDEELAAAIEEERALYLTPGGLYTLEDILANQNMTRSDKFIGFVPKHNTKPIIGDRICPITLTVANPKCTWVIGGKTYFFCCPPCIDEFLTMAKELPKEVLNPEEYVKR